MDTGLMNSSPRLAQNIENEMVIREFEIPEVKLIVPKRFTDERGFFSETWSDRWFRREIADVALVQDNQSVSTKRGTLRGLHFQKPPFDQAKLVRVVRGSIFDVAVDIRKGSPTFGRHVAARLDALEGAQLWVPSGFLHGFCTLEDDTEVLYKVSSYYSASHDAGVIWHDPNLGIDWPVDKASVVLSEKDQRLPQLHEISETFTFER
jgi:dTDP-4-dehydrorhamnose 3,5-epimerase